jgi:hypothetical protein
MKKLQEKCPIIIYRDRVCIFLLVDRNFYHMNKLLSWVFMWIIEKYPLACMAVCYASFSCSTIANVAMQEDLVLLFELKR